jgi:hypothetical protein
MSGLSTRVVRPFAGRDRAFDITPIGTIEALERACNAGMGEILVRLETVRFRHADIRETIRLGLMGAGMPEPEATQLVIDNVDGRPVAPQLDLAVAIMTAYAHGVADAAKKSDGPEAAAGSQTPPGPETSAPISSPA